jgi:glycosyltransferase involved in cell wall biosynthesis
MCVDPLDPEEIARAIEFMLKNPDKARRMGENGRAAAFKSYNWEKEEGKLLAMYENLIK